MTRRLRKAWAAIRKHWKAVLGGLTLLLAALYGMQWRRHRAKRVKLERKAREAGKAKDKAVAGAEYLQERAAAAGKRADAHQAEARAQVAKLREKRKKRPSLQDALDLAEKMNKRGSE